MTTRTITYTYDGLDWLTVATYFTGESYASASCRCGSDDVVGNRVALTATHGVAHTTGTTTYACDAAHRLTRAAFRSYQLPDSSL